LSCATHALGKMPLEVELLDVAGDRVGLLARSSDGSFCSGN
jgi:NAD-reducing hydrogenase large subunit